MDIDVGIAIVVDTRLTFKLSTNSSVYSAKTFAIFKMLELIISEQLRDSVIFSDSLSAVSSISDISNSYTMAIQNQIYLLYPEGKEIIIAWIPGHVSIFGNKLVNLLAKDSISSSIHITLVPSIFTQKN